MSVLVDTFLGVTYVAAGTVWSVTPEVAGRINATGVEEWREHTFKHPFMLMTFQFLVQALCLPLWYFVTGGQTRGRNQENNDNNAAAENNPENQGQNQIGYDEPMIHPGAPNIQDNQVANPDDEQLLDANGDEGEPEPQPVRPQREPIVPNNPAWNQRPVDNTKFNRFLFLAPAMFDVLRYGLLYLAIPLTYNSSFMMIRSSAVIFTVMLRVAFLSKHMAKYMWVSVSMVIVGLALVGMTDYIYETPPGYDKYGLAAGDLLIAMSQILIAMQFVFEEKFMDKHSIDPLKVVGMEGCYGALVSVILLIPFTYVESGPFSVLPNNHIVDLKDAFLQMRSSAIIALCVVGNVFSKVVYFYTGTKLVKNRHDSTTRITIDVHHDCIIWIISLLAGWQNYFWPQIIGLVMVPIGMGVYNDIIPLPRICLPPEVPRPAQGPPGEIINLDGNVEPRANGDVPDGLGAEHHPPPENLGEQVEGIENRAVQVE